METILSEVEKQNALVQLKDGIKHLNLDVSDFQIQQLIHYLELLLKWNKAYNLTALKRVEQMVSLHLLDSLSIVPYLADKKNISLIDVGTGAGLPGIVLAIMFPDWQVTLLDSNGKKMRFLFQVKSSLKLNNVELENKRVESYDSKQFDLVSSRAFASIGNMVSVCQHLLSQTGCFIAMKGQYPQQELDEALKQHSGLMLEDTHKIELPNEQAQRHLLMLNLTA